jgi:hypothetical protein
MPQRRIRTFYEVVKYIGSILVNLRVLSRPFVIRKGLYLPIGTAMTDEDTVSSGELTQRLSIFTQSLSIFVVR